MEIIKGSSRVHCWVILREGMPVQNFPKYRHCLDGGGSDLCLDFFEGFVHMHWIKGDYLSPKSDISPQKVFLIPRNRSFNHIYFTCSLSNMIYVFFVEKMLRVTVSHLYGPNRSGCLDWGVGGSACILGTFGPAFPPLATIIVPMISPFQSWKSKL